ncbi:MAG: ATP-grasp domain-containing protein [Gammaproteobacteria bacterium]|nr:ATP-grasp domain-containing protein [Gammaproteobacteria bacterium]
MLKYALIVDPFSTGALYAEELVKRNVTPLAVLSHSPIFEVYKDSFREQDFVKIFLYENDIDQLVSQIKLFLVDAEIVLCLAGSEPGVELSDLLAKEFSPDKSNNIDLSSARRNKFIMANQLHKSGVRVPLTIKVDSAKQALEWAKSNNFIQSGVVIKPLSSAGTDGVRACFSEAEVKNAVHDILGKKNKFNIINNDVLVQEFLTGTEYVVDSSSYQGCHTITNICCYKKIYANGSNFVYDYLDFLPNEGHIPEALTNYCFSVLDGLGIKNGPAHSEIMYTQTGPCLIETGARLHGGVAIRAARHATGSSQLDLTLEYMLGDKTTTANGIGFTLKNYVRIVFFISQVAGKVKAVSPNLHKISELPSFISMNFKASEGADISKTVDLFTALGLLILCHPNKEQLESDYQLIRQFEETGLVSIQ